MRWTSNGAVAWGPQVHDPGETNGAIGDKLLSMMSTWSQSAVV